MKSILKIGLGLTLIATLTACSNENEVSESVEVEESDNTTEVETVESVDTEETESTSTVSSSTTTTDRDYSYDMTESKEQAILLILQENMSGLADITFDEDTKTYFVLPTDPSLIAGINEYGLYGSFATEWQGIVESQITLSNVIQEELGNGYSIVMLNPSNINRTLLKVTDGEIIISI